MKIYVNDQYEILSLDNELQEYYKVFEVKQTRLEMFGDFCNACIQGYKYTPQYELLFNDDGSNARNEKTGELLYKLDDNGEKILQGYSCYPYVDFKTLTLIQMQHNDYQKQIQVLNAHIKYLSLMSGIGSEAGHE